MRVFLDANVLFSASLSKSRLAEFLGGLRRHAELVTNAYAAAEAERNIAAKQPRRLEACRELTASLKMAPLRLFDLGVRLAEKDQPILCGAIACAADFLLTGDSKDFGRLYGQTVQGVMVVSVAMLVEELVKRGILEEG